MSEGSKNIDSYLDGKFKNSLSFETSPEFTSELIKRVELEKVFAKEDLKTDKIVKYASGGFVILMAAVTVLFAMLFKTNSGGKEISYFNSALARFSDFIEYISLLTSENMGLTFNIQTGLVIFIAMLCIFIFSFADKIIFRKSLK